MNNKLSNAIELDETITQEIEMLDEDAIFEMANLATEYTGIRGTIFISTNMGKHGPRVNYL